MNRYPAYKPSGIKWIGDIPEHWEVKRLKYLAVANPSNIDKKSVDSEQEVFLCNYVDVYNNEFISSEIDFMKATASESQIESFTLKKGDVLLTKDSEVPEDIAVPALVKENLNNVVCGYHLTHVRANKDLKGGYLFRLFQSNIYSQYFSTLARGVTRFGLTTRSFKELPTIFPPPPEQTAIANFLDRKTAEIDQIIDDKEKLIELYEEEKKALINEAVTKGIEPNVKMKDSGIEWLGDIPEHWEVKKLKYLCTMIGGYAFQSKDFTDSGIQLIKIANLYNNQLSLNRQPTFLPKKFITDYSKWLVRNGDILMSMTGTLGKRDYGFAIEVSGDEEFFLNQRVSKINFNSNLVEPKLILHILRSEYFLNSLFSLPTGTKQGNLSNDQVMSIKISFPSSLAEQHELREFINKSTEEIDGKIDSCKKEILLLKEYRQALIFEAVTGKTCVLEEKKNSLN